MKKVLLIDGHSILSRAFYGIPMLTDPKGNPTNAIYGFLNIMLKVLSEERADYVSCAFDLERSALRRVELYPDYKGTRKPMPEELVRQAPLMMEMLSAMNIPVLTLRGYEADDILGTLAKRLQEEGFEVVILSGDRDLLQLADEHIRISLPKTSKGRTEVFSYFPDDVKREYGVTPEEFIDMKALMGDASDNIPGVPSIGEKTAQAIIMEYGSIEKAYENADSLKPPRAQKALKEHWDLAVLSKKLATIDTKAPLETDSPGAPAGRIYTKAALGLCRGYGFKSLIPRFAELSEKNEEAEEAAPRKDFFPAHLKTVRDPFMASVAFRDAAQEKTVGLSLLALPDRSAAAVSLSFADGRSFFMVSGAELSAETLLSDTRAMLAGLIEKGVRAAVPELKPLLKVLDIPRNRLIHDISIAAYVQDAVRSGYGTSDIARDFLGELIEEPGEILGKKKPEELLREAAETAGDPEALRRLLTLSSYVCVLALPRAEKRLREEGSWDLYYDVELPLIYTLDAMEKAGIRMDKERLGSYAARLKTEIDEKEALIYEEAGEMFNINSPVQLGHILFEKLGLKGGKKTKTGYSTSADVLQKLAEDSGLVRNILRYRTLTKLYSTYAMGLTAFVGPDGRIHGTFNQNVTATGRISSTDPNLQNIPIRTEEGREIRKVFIPAEGELFLDADYSQVELRILAALSGDEKLIGAYRDAVDIHSLTASEVFHVPLSEVTKQMRSNAKAVNFGIVYGISAFGLGEGLSIDRKEAAEYIERYFATYPGVKRYLDSQVESAREKGYVTTFYGRRRPVPDIKASNFQKRSFSERVAMNSPIQGTAADIMKIAMNRVEQRLTGLDKDGNRVSEPMRSRIVLQVHDELLVETVPEEAEAVRELLREEMEGAADLKVRLIAEVRSGEDWDSCH